jgi:hypothetical protein
MEYAKPKQDKKSFCNNFQASKTRLAQKVCPPKCTCKLIFSPRLLLHQCCLRSQLKELETKVIKMCREQNYCGPSSGFTVISAVTKLFTYFARQPVFQKKKIT